MEANKAVYVIGHKNPDTDSVCSAIAYAYYKEKMENHAFTPMRAGQISDETQYVLTKFGAEAPERIEDVRTQVRDIEIDELHGIDGNLSIKKAWALMKELNVVTLPIVLGSRLQGLITTEDITTSYMDVYDSRVLSEARTQYRNILETLDGTLLTGNEHGYFIKGKVMVGAGSPETIEESMEGDDLVILGNRYEAQLCAIEMNASCLVICNGAKVAGTIVRLAQEKQCVIISTPHDTFTVSRLINQSIPVRFIMRKKNLVTFSMDDYVEDLKDIMAKKKYRNFPILDNGNYAGMISRRRLINNKRKRLILVDHNERSQAVDGIQEAEILEIIDHHRLGSMETIAPVFFRNQPVGCTSTILFQMYREADVEIPKKIAGLLCCAIISDTLLYRSPTCTADDRAAAEELAVIAGIDPKETASEMFRAGSNLRDKEASEIMYQDYKEFTAGDIVFGVGQISSMSSEELGMIRGKMLSFMKNLAENSEGKMYFFMMTNILEEATELLGVGRGVEEVIEQAFDQKMKDGSLILKGVVSRKKQLIPALIVSIQQ